MSLKFGDFIEESPGFTKENLLEDFDLLREQFKDTLPDILSQLPKDQPITIGWLLKAGPPADPLNVHV